VNCDAQGIVERSTVCDHIVPVEVGGSEDDLENMQGLCDRLERRGHRGRGCHDVKRQAESRGRQLQVIEGVGFRDVGPLGRVPARRVQRTASAA
jgi:hypothetical protein